MATFSKISIYFPVFQCFSKNIFQFCPTFLFLTMYFKNAIARKKKKIGPHFRACPALSQCCLFLFLFSYYYCYHSLFFFLLFLLCSSFVFNVIKFKHTQMNTSEEKSFLRGGRTKKKIFLISLRNVEFGAQGVEWHPYLDSEIPQITGQPEYPGKQLELSGQNLCITNLFKVVRSGASCGASCFIIFSHFSAL